MAIVNLYRKFKRNNKGVSLIEVLVTIAMIIILAGPLINSFLNSRIVNSNARLIQNGTTVAQDMAEKFKTIPIEQLCSTYAYEKNDSTGVYTFKDIAVEGPNKEKFLVDVTLDPNAYKVGNEDQKKPVNNEKLPSMSSIYGSNCIKLYKYYTAIDEKLKDYFKPPVVPDQSIVDNLYESRRVGLSKNTSIHVERLYSNATDRYEYEITLTMQYTFKYKQPYEHVYTVKTVEHQEEVKGISFTPQEEHIIYLVCPIFDICNNDGGYCTDKINITYNFYDEDATIKPNVYFYLAEQETYNRGNASLRQRINPYNVNINSTLLPLYISNISNEKLKLCTNIMNPDNVELLDLTYAFKDAGISLYEMKVEVSLKGEDKVVAEFISTK